MNPKCNEISLVHCAFVSFSVWFCAVLRLDNDKLFESELIAFAIYFRLIFAPTKPTTTFSVGRPFVIKTIVRSFPIFGRMLTMIACHWIMTLCKYIDHILSMAEKPKTNNNVEMSVHLLCFFLNWNSHWPSEVQHKILFHTVFAFVPCSNEKQISFIHLFLCTTCSL